MSALTATGATALTGLDRLPATVNIWRCFLQYIGGLGIILLAVAVLRAGTRRHAAVPRRDPGR